MRWMAWPIIASVLAGAAYVLWPRPTMVATSGFDADSLVAAAEALSQAQDRNADAADGASPIRPVTFPDDHGAHPDSLTEVWDLTANLHGPDEMTLVVRSTLATLRLGAGRAGALEEGHASSAPMAADHAPRRRASALAAEQVLAASLVVMSNSPGTSARGQRLSRSALGLAGTDTAPDGSGRIWVEDWELVRDQDGHLTLMATLDETQLSLTLVPAKPPVVLDSAAMEDAADGGAGAMQLYSQSRLAVAGSMRAQGRDYELHGSAWLDHAWGELSSAISGQRGQLVGNRFQLQLDNGVELACLHLRRRSGGGIPVARCSLITVDSDHLTLERREVTLEPAEDGWREHDGVRYPLSWRLLIPGRGLELEVGPLLDRGSAVSLRPVSGAAASWSGPVAVRGWRESDAIGGVGRMDLTGYGDTAPFGT